MGMLSFKAADLRRVVEHSIGNRQSEQLVDYDPSGKAITKPVEAPAVLLVHDQGVYLMSNGNPRDIVGGVSSHVAYAKGCNPKTDSDWYDTAHALVGGDDFGETLPWAREIKALIDGGADTIFIRFDDTIELLTEA